MSLRRDSFISEKKSPTNFLINFSRIPGAIPQRISGEICDNTPGGIHYAILRRVPDEIPRRIPQANVA